MKIKSELTLYFKDTCPFCRKVLDYLDDLKKTVPMKNIKGNPEYSDELEKISGKRQVPCLVIDNDPLLESDAIVLWLEEHKILLEDTPAQERL
ncbi:glutaredoxin [Candidatus Aerophobetes bacterium]|uniref:Glutaredoxin n=1 Tax=Aerophobetes bacterium TaxID=2030807 RepID=A0A2A4YB83_UNCAE|nr:MAG: glutaredoxin [Candidatus Aerophobetes bacterium]